MFSRGEVRRRSGGAWAAFACLTVFSMGACVPTAQAQAQSDAATDVAEPASDAVELTIANRRIFTMRGHVAGVSPADRAWAVRQRVDELVERGGPLEVSTREIPEGTAVLLDGNFVFRVLQADVDPESAETTQTVAAEAVRNLAQAIDEIRESRDARTMLVAAGYALLATLVLVSLLWLLRRSYAWLAPRLRDFVHRRSATLAPGWGSDVVGRVGLPQLAIMPLRLLAWVVVLLLIYEWITLVLGFFPYTRPWSETLLGGLLDVLGGFGMGLLRSVPDLLFVVLIFIVTRFIVRVVRVFFDGVQAGRVHVGWVDETTARPTERLLTAIIWLFALVAAYPYLPGSGSEAFKGIGVFVGLMLSIGASGVVNQAVSGLMLMYTRALRPGEFVQIGDTEGTVTSVGFLTTRVETLRHELINIPNAVIASTVTRNYSRLAGEGGVRLLTKITIGYDTPWRQVQAMLQIAAERTSNVVRDPPPRVLQTALQDFYVEYTLLVSILNPAQKFIVLNELHGHIQDVFNEHGVQIMSPNYVADPAEAKVVPVAKWYEPPAAK
jgi:small-conductance mechanosensitive channel